MSDHRLSIHSSVFDQHPRPRVTRPVRRDGRILSRSEPFDRRKVRHWLIALRVLWRDGRAGCF